MTGLYGGKELQITESTLYPHRRRGPSSAKAPDWDQSQRTENNDRLQSHHTAPIASATFVCSFRLAVSMPNTDWILWDRNSDSSQSQ